MERKKVTRITVEYNRVTKIEPNPILDVDYEYITWDYSEKLTIDRESETMEYFRRIGTNCDVMWKYHIGDVIEALLDSIDVTVFDEIEGNPPDAFDDPMETKTYRIVISFADHTDHTITGTFDKKGLPKEWESFANTICEHMDFYGAGEIFDRRHYEMQRLSPDSVIYLSVTFFESYKRYYYQTNDNRINVGDYVVVPVGEDGKERIVEVRKKEYYQKDSVPMPLEKVKTVIEKFTPPPKDNPMIHCPVLNKLIYDGECYEHCNGICSDFDKAQEELCDKCRYHS